MVFVIDFTRSIQISQLIFFEMTLHSAPLSSLILIFNFDHFKPSGFSVALLVVVTSIANSLLLESVSFPISCILYILFDDLHIFRKTLYGIGHLLKLTHVFFRNVHLSDPDVNEFTFVLKDSIDCTHPYKDYSSLLNTND